MLGFWAFKCQNIIVCKTWHSLVNCCKSDFGFTKSILILCCSKKKLLPVKYMYMSGKLCINANQRGHRWKKVGIPKFKLSIKVNSIKYDSVFSGLCITICPVTKWTQRWSTPSRNWIYPSTPQGPTQAVWPMTCTALYAILVVRIKYTQIVLICQIYIQK